MCYGRDMSFRRSIAVIAFIIAAAATATAARAIELPMTADDVKAAIVYGQQTPVERIVADPAMQLGSMSATVPWGSIQTPFELLAFGAAQAQAKYESISSDWLREAKAATTFDVDANAFSTALHMNDEMTVVIKQGNKVIHAASKKLDSDAEVLTLNDEAGYRTALTASFSYKAVNVHEPFTVVIANYGMAGREYDFDVDPTQFR